MYKIYKQTAGFDRVIDVMFDWGVAKFWRTRNTWSPRVTRPCSRSINEKTGLFYLGLGIIGVGWGLVWDVVSYGGSMDGRRHFSGRRIYGRQK